MKHSKYNKIKKILVIRTDRMGETLLNIPAIRALKSSFGATIFVLANPALKELLVGFPEIDQIIPFEQGLWNKSILFRLRLLAQIRKSRFDLAVIFNPARRFHILTYLAGIPLRLGYDRKWGFLLTDKIKDRKFEGQKHEVEYNLDLVRSIGADTENLGICLRQNEQDRQFVKELLASHGISDKDLIIAIHPFSSNSAKCWPKDNFAFVLEGLGKKFPAKTAIIGSRQERSAALKLNILTRNQAVNLCGKLTLRQLVAFLHRSPLLIANDSGPVHIAAACNTPTIVIFGRNIPGVGPKRWGPWNSSSVVMHKDPGCEPCADRNCPYGYKCLTAVSPEEVLQAAEKIIRIRK